MSDRIKKIKVKKADGSMTDYIPIGVDAENVDFNNGFNLDNIVGSINPDESGSIATQLNKSIKYYDCVADMKADITLNEGAARTLGYYEPGDGGAGLYEIIDSTDARYSTSTNDGGSIHDLTNGNKALLIIDKSLDVQTFGAYGDGNHDDTAALQAAIDYCRNTNLTLTSKGNKIYLVTSSLMIISKCNIDFNYATVKTNSAIKIFHFNTPMTEAYNGGFMRNIVIDMNNIATYGIYCELVIKKIFSNIEIKNCSETAFHFESGYEVFFQNSHLYGTSSHSVGLSLQKGDSHYNDIIMIDMHTGILLHRGGPHFFERIHAWIWHNSYLKDSKFVHVESNGCEAWLNQCYSDTYQYCYYSESDWARINLTQCKSYNNENFMTTTWLETNGDHYLFYAKDGLASQLSKIWVNSGHFTGLQKETESYLHAHIHNLLDSNNSIINMTGQVELTKWDFDGKRDRCNQTQLEITNASWAWREDKQHIHWAMNNVSQIIGWLSKIGDYDADTAIQLGKLKSSNFNPVPSENIYICPIFKNGNYSNILGYATLWVMTGGNIYISIPAGVTTQDNIYVNIMFLNQRGV